MEENNNKNDDANIPAPEAYNETDIFLWANNLVQYKDELKFDLYFISKNYML